MERPLTFSAEDVRDEKVRVLKAIPAVQPKDTIIGQYGKSLDGSKPGYKEDDTVPEGSRCPTFASMVAYVKNERWEGVPFILKAGKGKFQHCLHSTESILTEFSAQRAENRSADSIQRHHQRHILQHPP